MRLGNVSLPLDGQGLVLLLGENRDASKASSNGAGKSALLDALCWCLWGKTIRGKKDDGVVRRDVGRDCKVVVEWLDGDSHYRVTRYRLHTGPEAKKPNDVVFEVNGETDDGAGMAKTQERIIEALGLSFRTFQAMMPGAGVKVAELTDGGVKELLETLLQMDVISKAQDITKKKLAAISEDLLNKRRKVQQLETKAAEYRELIQTYSEAQKSFEEDKRKEVLDVQAKIGDLLDRREQVLVRVKAKEEAQKTLDNVTARASTLRDEKRAALIAEKQHNIILAEYNANSRETIAGLKTELRLLNDKITKLKGLGDVCDHCGQTISGEYKSQQTVRNQAVYEKALENCTDVTARINESRIALEANCRAAETTVKKLSEDIALLNNQAMELKATITDGEYAQREADDLWVQMGSLSELQDEIVARTAPFKGLIANAVDNEYEITAESLEIKAAIKDLEVTEENLKFWVEGFSARGLRSLMLQHVTPILNSRVKYYADILTDSEMTINFSTERQLRSGKTKEEFTVQVIQKDGDDSYCGSSSGERAKADLAIAFALGDLAQLRANKRISFRFLDEPFESIDATGHESIVRLLNEQRLQYSTVFCITHKESFQQLFPKAFKVVKENGVSRLEQAHE